MTVESLKYGSIRFSEAGIAELSGDRQTGFVPLEDIRSVVVCHGSISERPGRELVYAAIAGLVGLMAWESSPVSAALVFALGAWIAHHAMRFRYHLEVGARGYARRLVFKGRVHPGELVTVLAAARAQFGYPVTSTTHKVSIGLK